MRPAFCPQPGADLCADFESASSPGAGFTNVTSRGSASGAVDQRSMLVTVPSSAQTASAYAPYLETMSMLGEARIVFAFRADTLPAILTIAVVSYQQDQYAAALQLAMGNLYVVEQRAGIIDTPFTIAHIDPSAWHVYELVVSPQRRKLEATIDGTVSSFSIAANQTFGLAGKKTLSVGAVDSSAVLPATAARFDDIALFLR